jgi:glycosyltransferase involved in cell wall biosynthesis
MKIAYLTGALRRGGTETLLLDTFKSAEIADYQFIGIHRKDGELKNEFYKTGQKLFKMSPKFSCDAFYLLRLRKLLKMEQIDIIHAQQSLDAFYGWIATIGLNIKVIQTFHGFDKPNKKDKLISFIAKRAINNIFVSNYQREYYTKKYYLKPEKQITIYNGISFAKITNYTNVTALFKDNYAGILLGSVGNFVDVRSQIVICKFLKLLDEHGTNFRFVFAGLRIEKQAHYYDNCVNFCKQNGLLNTKVFFIGGRDDIPNILKQLDAFVYSSAHDTFGLSVIEAIAAEVPVFVNDWVVMREITENGNFATIFQSENENDLLQKFLVFLQNITEYKKRAKDIALKVKEKYDIKQYINELYRQYKLLEPK